MGMHITFKLAILLAVFATHRTYSSAPVHKHY